MDLRVDLLSFHDLTSLYKTSLALLSGNIYYSRSLLFHSNREYGRKRIFRMSQNYFFLIYCLFVINTECIGAQR